MRGVLNTRGKHKQMRPPWLLRARRRVGRRGSFLLTFGFVYVLLGLGLLGRPPPDPDEAAVYEYVLRVMPFTAWGCAAIIAGATSWAGAVLRRWHVDAAGFALLQAVAAGWAMATGVAAIASMDAAAARSSLTWLTLSTAIGIVSGWPEPPR